MVNKKIVGYVLLVLGLIAIFGVNILFKVEMSTITGVGLLIGSYFLIRGKN